MATEGKDYIWSDLEYRICREVRGFKEHEWRGWWCDGVVVRFRREDDGCIRLMGIIWAGKDGQIPMDLEIRLPSHITCEEQLEWDELLPPEDLTGWLWIDVKKKRVVIDTSKGERITETHTKK
jgi:hypothetical protein